MGISSFHSASTTYNLQSCTIYVIKYLLFLSTIYHFNLFFDKLELINIRNVINCKYYYCEDKYTHKYYRTYIFYIVIAIITVKKLIIRPPKLVINANTALALFIAYNILFIHFLTQTHLTTLYNQIFALSSKNL